MMIDKIFMMTKYYSKKERVEMKKMLIKLKLMFVILKGRKKIKK